MWHPRLTVRCLGRSGPSGADGHDVDPVDVFRLALHARLDAAYQRLDLSTPEVIVDVQAGDNPGLARADEGDEDFAQGGYSRVGEEEGSYSLHRPARAAG
jgi:hypothetical protein